MLRVGLTGGLGSGKSTAARMLASRGAHVLSSDELGRDLMQPGKPVFAAIVDRFGPTILSQDGSLNRGVLARLAFSGSGANLEALNAIVHPAVIARQAELTDAFAAAEPHAIVAVESALLFETEHAGPQGWNGRFDRILLVRADEERKIARFTQRSLGTRVLSPELAAELQAEARRRLSLQLDDDAKAVQSDYILTNNGSVAELELQVEALWPTLVREAEASRPETSTSIQ